LAMFAIDELDTALDPEKKPPPETLFTVGVGPLIILS